MSRGVYKSILIADGRLSVPTAGDGRVPLGAEAADVVYAIAVELWDENALPFRRAERAASALQHSFPYAPTSSGTLSHRLEGLLTNFRTYCALVPNADEPTNFAILRIALVVWLCHPTDIAEARVDQSLSRVLTRPHSVSARFRDKLSTLREGFNQRQLIEPSIGSGLHFQHELDAIRIASRLLTFEMRQQQGRAEFQNSPTGDVEPTPAPSHTDDDDEEEVAYRAPSDRVEPDERIECQPARLRIAHSRSVDGASSQLDRLSEWDGRQLDRLYLHGPLIPGTDRSLHPCEARIAVTRFAAMVEANTTESFGALVNLLVTVLGAPLSHVLHALRQHLLNEAPTAGIRFQIDADRIVRHAPRKMADVSAAGHVHADAAQTWSHRMPPWLATHLTQAKADKRYHRHLSYSLEGAIRDARYIASSVKRTVSRLSQRRLQNALPILIFANCRDVSAVQWIVGDALGQSLAPLSYYSTTQGRLRSIYHQAVTDLWPETWIEPLSPEHDDASIIGAPRASFDEDRVRHAINALRARYQQAARNQRGVQNRIEAHNQLAYWTTAFFAAAVCHRITHRLRLITRRSVLLSWPEAHHGIAVFRDKTTANGSSWRVAPLTSALCAQLVIYLRSAERLRDALPAGDRWQRLRRDLDRIISGRGALFQTVNDLAAVPFLRPLQRKHLSAAWPEWAGDDAHGVYTLRHRLYGTARHTGVSAEDIRRLAGHATLVPPWSAGDLDSVPAMIRRTAAPLEQALRADGWSCIGGRVSVADCRHFNCAPISAVEITRQRNREQHEHRKRWRRVVRRRHQIAHRLKTLIRQRIERSLQALALVDDNGPKQDVELAPEQTARILCDALHGLRDGGEIYATTQLLRVQLRHLRRHHGWSLQLPDLPRTQRPLLPEITQASLEALRWMLAVDRWLRRTSTGAASELPATFTARCAAQLALHGGLLSIRRIVSALTSAQGARQLDSSDGVAVDLSERAHRGNAWRTHRHPAVRCGVTVAGLAGLALVAVQRQPERLSRVGAIRAAHRLIAESNLPIEVRTGRSRRQALNEVLRAIGLARQLTQRGMRSGWEQEALRMRGFTVDQLQNFAGDRPSGRGSDAYATIITLSPAHVPSAGASQAVTNLAFVRRLTAAIWNAKRKGVRRTSEDAVSLMSWLHDNTALAASSDLCRVLHAYVSERAAEIEASPASRRAGEMATLHEDITTALPAFAATLGALDFLSLTSELLTECVLITLRQKTDSTRQRAARTLIDLAAAGHRLGGATLDVEDLEDELDIDVPLAAPYAWNRAELHLARRHLDRWRSDMQSIQTAGGCIHPLQLEAAGVAAILGGRLSLRSGEALSLRLQDVETINDCVLLHVRPTHFHRLKSQHSHRTLVLNDHLTADELAAILEYGHRIRAAWGVHATRETTLLSAPIAVVGDTDPRMITDLIRSAISPHTDAKSCRFHAGRHLFVNDRLLKLPLPYAFSRAEPSAAKIATGPPPDESACNYLALRIARAAGHGETTVTFGSYAHVLTHLCGSGDELDAVTVTDAANLLGMAPTSLRHLAKRMGSTLETGNCASMIRAASGSAPGNAAVCELPGPLPPPTLRQEATVARPRLMKLLRCLLEMARGVPIDEIEIRWGLPPKGGQALHDTALRLERQRRYHLLDRRSHRANADHSRQAWGARARIPRPALAEHMLRALERLRNESPSAMAALRTCIHLQDAFNGAVRHPSDRRLDMIRAALTAIAPPGHEFVERFDGAQSEFFLLKVRSRGRAGVREQASLALFMFVVAVDIAMVTEDRIATADW